MPQLKSPITSIEMMICEHCIHFQQTPKCREPYCINPDSDDWDRETGETCSHGDWLWATEYPDNPCSVRICSYRTLTELFAELNELPRNPR